MVVVRRRGLVVRDCAGESRRELQCERVWDDDDRVLFDAAAALAALVAASRLFALLLLLLFRSRR